MTGDDAWLSTTVLSAAGEVVRDNKLGVVGVPLANDEMRGL